MPEEIVQGLSELAEIRKRIITQSISVTILVWMLADWRAERGDLCVLDAEDGMGSAAGIMVVGCRRDSVSDAFLQKAHGLFAV